MRINLLPKDERPLKQSQVRWGFLVGLVGFLALAAVLTFSWVENARWQALSAAYNEALAREALLQRQVQSVTALRQQIAALEAEETLYRDLMPEQPSPAAALAVASSQAAGQLWIEKMVWSGAALRINGYTRDVAALSGYLTQLQSWAAEADLRQLTPQEGSDFHMFAIEVKGVPRSAAVELD